jgi:hypothetical protein
MQHIQLPQSISTLVNLILKQRNSFIFKNQKEDEVILYEGLLQERQSILNVVSMSEAGRISISKIISILKKEG